MHIENQVLIKVSDSDIKDGQFVIPEDVTTIGRVAFYGCKTLSSIFIPKSVTIIEEGAFASCAKLRSIVIPEDITRIRSQTFENCSSLSSIIIPESVTTIAWQAFMGCTSLNSIVIPKKVHLIGCAAFLGCSSLSSIVIPKSVVTIAYNAFKNCTSLSIIHIDADTQEDYERILKLLPPELQKTIQANIQAVVKKATLFLACATQGHGFFRENAMPRELTTPILARFVEEYKIPSFMILKALKESGSAKGMDYTCNIF